ncbi:MAG: ATP-binding protein [Candidatus Parvarchaeota archaeon]|nr:ATP-binding protein [Candidatus Jingweiarchaeum tengchongense]MCW1297678.1 ATP-binding protein [Candidatus Jingweiarchaeum tengchongense]MCW1299689.1 ATP-binding protein [Candidatus Jingweiarchaeum tengchongense]MCW1304343.1 ATP-binding protein [Candidatus Jingweiarchaeum tengchongense]MCW1305674.1 ATP-binding protein [Candidatus Jingweiarchaeum tengchongense]
MDTWFVRYGWKSNPFIISADPQIFVGFDDIKRDLHEIIISGDSMNIFGPPGSGKSSLLLHFQKLLDKKKYATIFIDPVISTENSLVYEFANTIGKQNILDIILRRTPERIGFLNFLKMKLGDRRPIIFLDEAHLVNNQNVYHFLRAFHDHLGASIIMASTKRIKSHKPFKDAFRNRIVWENALRPMQSDEATRMIQLRILNSMQSKEESNPFSEEALNKIFHLSSYIPREILVNCERVCRFYANEGIRPIDDKMVEHVLKRVPRTFYVKMSYLG